jgi:hypothetical protein
MPITKVIDIIVYLTTCDTFQEYIFEDLFTVRASKGFFFNAIICNDLFLPITPNLQSH